METRLTQTERNKKSLNKLGIVRINVNLKKEDKLRSERIPYTQETIFLAGLDYLEELERQSENEGE